MTIPTNEPISEESASLPPARRRRQRRMILPEDASERGEFLRELAREAVPSFDFFLYSLLAGVALAVAILSDAPALFVLAAMLAPLMAPVMGACLGALAGSLRFTMQSLGSLGIGSLIVFLCGAAAGWAVNLLPMRSYTQAVYYSQFHWTYFLVLLIGVALTAYITVRARHTRPLVASVALAYALYPPLAVSGFGLTSGNTALWMSALGLFLIHLLWAVTAGIAALVLSGLRPLHAGSFLASGAWAAAALLLLIFPVAQPGVEPLAVASATSPASVAGAAQQQTTTHTPPPSSTPQPSATPAPSETASPTLPPTATRSLAPTRTATLTITPVPTPLWARISASEGGGALVREEPEYTAEVISSVLNDTLVEVLPELTENGGVAWVRVRLLNGKEGWMVRSLLRTATPAPGN